MTKEDYQKWEIESKRIQIDNKALVKEFEKWLADKGLGKKTITNHSQNIDFYINDYLLYSDTIEAKDGALEIGGFLGDWFIRKAAWSSQAHIKANVASLKKFYTFLMEKGEIDKSELRELKVIIKEDMPDWLDNMKNEEEDWGW